MAVDSIPSCFCQLTLESNFIYLAAHNAVVLKAESMADKVEWVNKIRKVIQSRGGQVIGASTEGGHSMRHSLSDGSLVSLHSLAQH